MGIPAEKSWDEKTEVPETAPVATEATPAASTDEPATDAPVPPAATPTE